MILGCVCFLGLMVLFSRGASVLSYFISIEILFFFFIFFFGTGSGDMTFLWSLVIAVAASILTLTFLVSGMIFFGSDSQSTYLD